MQIEVEVVGIFPPSSKSSSIRKYIPVKTNYKKVFTAENMHIEQFLTPKGKIDNKYTMTKYEGDYYKLNIPYKKLRDQYFKPIVVRGFIR